MTGAVWPQLLAAVVALCLGFLLAAAESAFGRVGRGQAEDGEGGQREGRGGQRGAGPGRAGPGGAGPGDRAGATAGATGRGDGG